MASTTTTAMPPDRHALLYKVFQGMDADGSDYVDHMEFKGIFSEAGEKHSDERLKEIDAIRGRGDTDGRLTADELCGFMLEYMADKSDVAFQQEIDVWMERLAKSHRKLLLRRVFERMDTDKSGGVSLQEFKALADEDVGTDKSEAYFRWIEKAQGNGDGMLTVDEWVPFVLEMELETSNRDFQELVDDWLTILKHKRRVVLLKQVYAKMDADSSGEVDLTEFANLKSGDSDEDSVLSMIFHYLDGKGNSDGMLSLDEWVNGMREMGEEMDDDAFEAEVAKWVLLLTNNQRAIWRGVFAKGNAASLVTAMRAAGATHVLLIHHGNAAPMTSATGDAPTDDIKAADSARPLTNQGTAQCMVAREEWFGRLPVRQVILSSPAKRATETAMHMAGRSIPGHEDNNETPLVLCEMLHPSIHGETGAASCEELFAQKGFAPLRSYLDAEMGEQAFGVYAEAACSELTAQFRAHGKGREKATYVSIFGQAVFINAIAHAVACAAGARNETLDPVLEIDLGEAEGILVPLYGGPPIQHLKRPL